MKTIGHFDNEIDLVGTEGFLKCRKVDNGTYQKVVFVFPVGHRVNVLA